MSQPGQEVAAAPPPMSRRVRFARLAALVLTACGLLAAALAVSAPASAGPGHGTNTATKSSNCDRPGASPHWTLRSHTSTTPNFTIRVSANIDAENVFYDSDGYVGPDEMHTDTATGDPTGTAIEGFCHNPESFEVWYERGSTQARARNQLDLYATTDSSDAQYNEQNPESAHADIMRWQWNFGSPQAAAFGTAFVNNVASNSWICAIVRINTERVGHTSSANSGHLADSTVGTDKNGPSTADRRGQFTAPLCMRPGAGKKVEWDHNCDADGDRNSGELNDADLNGNGKLEMTEIHDYKCSPHPCDIDGKIGITIRDLNTNGSTKGDSWPQNGFATLDGNDTSKALCRTLCDANTGDVSWSSDENRHLIGTTTTGTADGTVNWADANSKLDHLNNTQFNANPRVWNYTPDNIDDPIQYIITYSRRPNGTLDFSGGDKPYPWTKCGMNKNEAILGRQPSPWGW